MTTLTTEEVLKMAREAGFGLRYEGRGQILSAPTTTEKLESFAKLVADKATSREREACAKVCEAIDSSSDYYGERVELVCAEAIRARSGATLRGTHE